MESRKKKESEKEPEVIIRPVSRFGGLDTIHIALIALVLVLIGIVLLLSFSKPVVITRNVTNSTSINCTYFYAGKCVVPTHNASQVKAQVGRILASYTNVNSSLSLGFPFYSNISGANVSFLPSKDEWYVVVPMINPIGNVSYKTSFLLYDSNLTLATPFIQTITPSKILGNEVVAQGVISVEKAVACTAQTPLRIFWFIDPYAPGSIQSLSTLISLENKYGSNLNASIEIVYGPYSQLIGSVHGYNNTIALGKYIFCASKQSAFQKFVPNLESAYANAYMPISLLNSIATYSGLNVSMLNSCIASSTTAIDAQGYLASYYNITTTPMAIVGCKYLAIPQTANNAICYANESLCK